MPMRAILLTSVLLLPLALPHGAALPCVAPVPVACATLLLDQTILPGETRVLDDDAYLVAGVVNVARGGTLVLLEGHFTFVPGRGAILAEDNSTVLILGSTLFREHLAQDPPQMAGAVLAQTGSRLVMTGATTSNIRTRIETNDFLVEGNDFNGTHAIYLSNVNATFRGNTFRDAPFGALVANEGSPTLSMNTCLPRSATGACVNSFEARLTILDQTCVGAARISVRCGVFNGGTVDIERMTCDACSAALVGARGAVLDVTASSLSDRADPTSTGIILSEASRLSLTGSTLADWGVGVSCQDGSTLTQSGTTYPGTLTPTVGC